MGKSIVHRSKKSSGRLHVSQTIQLMALLGLYVKKMHSLCLRVSVSKGKFKTTGRTRKMKINAILIVHLNLPEILSPDAESPSLSLALRLVIPNQPISAQWSTQCRVQLQLDAVSIKLTPFITCLEIC